MKRILIILSFVISTSAFAISDSNLIKKCEAKGLEKLIASAEQANCDYVRDSLQVVDIDNRFYNPSKYVWYGFAVRCGDDLFKPMHELVQYISKTGECL